MEQKLPHESGVISALFTINFIALFAGFGVDFVLGDGTFTRWFGFLTQRITFGLTSLDLGNLGYGLFSAFSYQFLHGGVMHFFSNMALLILFGSYVEASMGPRRFLGFYLSCGFFAAAFHYLFNIAAFSAVIGASGAVSGVGGAFIVLILLRKIPLSSFTFMGTIVIGMWLYGQFQSAFQEMIGNGDGVAYLAHVGGFIAGVLLSFTHERVKGKAA